MTYAQLLPLALACLVGPSRLVGETGAELRAPEEELSSGQSGTLGMLSPGQVSTLTQGHSRGFGSQTGAWGQPEPLCCAGTDSS